MEQVGVDFAATGSVLTRAELEDQRRKRGECLTCGRKCFMKKLFKMVPITEPGMVLNGRCLECKPIDLNAGTVVSPPSRRTTQQDIVRFSESQSRLSGPGIGPSQRSYANMSRRRQSIPSTGINPPSLSAAVSSPQYVSTQSPREAPSPGRTQRGVSMSAVIGNDINSFRRCSSDVGTNDDAPHDDRETSHSSDRYGGRSSNSVEQELVAEERHQAMQSQPHGSRPRPAEMDQIYLATVASVASSMASRRHKDESEADVAPSSTAAQRASPDYSRRHQEEEEYARPPVHGVLNRGGAVSFSRLRTSRNARQESAGSLSTCSADESAMNGGTQSSSRHSRRDSVPNASHDDDDYLNNGSYHATPSIVRGTGNVSVDDTDSTHNRRRNSGQHSRNKIVEEAEDRALEQVHSAGKDYKLLVSLMKKHPASNYIQQEAMKSLSLMELDEGDLEELLSLGAMDACVMGLRSQPHEIDVQIHGCRAMWNLSTSTKNQVGLMKAGALGAVLTAMLGFSSDPEVQENSLAVISNLCLAEENLKDIMEGETVKKVVETMNKHSEDAAVQAQGCVVIRNLAFHDSAPKPALMEAGAAGSAAISMILHPNDVKLQEDALHALRNLCTNCCVNTIALPDVGGIDAAITAMQVHRDEPGVQEAGAWALSVFSVSAENQAIIGDGGGIDVCVRAMWVHSDVLGVQEWCCSALCKLTEDVPNRDFVVEVGGISALVNAMQAYGDEASVQERALAVLANLAMDDYEYKVKILEEECLDAIVLAMVLHVDSMPVQREACKVLLALVVDYSVEILKAANVTELVKTAAKKFPQECQRDSRQLLDIL